MGNCLGKEPCFTTDCAHLPDVFIKVPHMLESYLHTPLTRVADIAALRLVNKDLAISALSVVRACVVQLGEGAGPDQQHVSWLRSCTKLQQMYLILIIRAGKNAPPAGQQLTTCTLQANALIAGMGAAFRKITRIHLTVRHVWHNKRCLRGTVFTEENNEALGSEYSIGSSSMHTESAPSARKRSQKIQHTAASVQLQCTGAVMSAVFEVLSAAVPHLQHLSLLGHCTTASLQAFHAHFPQLNSLTLEASSMPATVLQKLHTQLPNITHLKMVKHGNRGNDLPAFVAASLPILNRCLLLTSLELDFGLTAEYIEGTEAAWKLLPKNLLELTIASPPEGWESQFEHPNLQRLTLLRLRQFHMGICVCSAPRLQALRVLGDVNNTVCVGLLFSSYMLPPLFGMPSLSQRLSTMHISCSMLTIIGSTKQLCNLLAQQNPVPTTVTLKLILTTACPTDFLQDIARVFPNLVKLVLKATVIFPFAGILSDTCLVPLARCTALKEIKLRLTIPFTTEGLATLCLALPVLTRVTCCPSPGLDHRHVARLLHNKQPRCHLRLRKAEQPDF